MENGKFKIGDVCIFVSRPEVDTMSGVELGEKVRVTEFLDPENWYNTIGVIPVRMGKLEDDDKKIIKQHMGTSGESWGFCGEENLELVE